MADARHIGRLSRAALATAVVLLASCNFGTEFGSVTIPYQPPAEHVAVLGGTITDFDTGLPVAGVLVQVGSLDGFPYSATSAANGAYEVSGIRMTQALLTYSRPGYQTFQSQRVLVSGYNPLPLRLRMSVAATAP